MQKLRGFSLIELLIVVAIILIIAAIAIPSLMRSRMAANESSAVESLRTINSAEVTYNSTYPTIGFAPALANLGPGGINVACPTPATSTASCLIDGVLASNGNPAGSGKSGYLFSTGVGLVADNLNAGYTVLAVPSSPGQTGQRAFCTEQDGVVRVDANGVCSNTEAGILNFPPIQ